MGRLAPASLLHFVLQPHLRRAWCPAFVIVVAFGPQLVPAHPEVPLHDNAAELRARQRAGTFWVKRDVSFGPRTAAGAKAWDTCMSLAATTKKLGISFYHYIHDRIASALQVANLAAIIDARVHDLNLGASWGPT